jgi:hypothetical protein
MTQEIDTALETAKLLEYNRKKNAAPKEPTVGGGSKLVPENGSRIKK